MLGDFSVSLFYVCVIEKEKTLSQRIFVSSESFGLFDYGLHRGVDRLKTQGCRQNNIHSGIDKLN